MARQLKRWESPRREGRNDKGRGGSARQRQRKKQFQALKQKLKEQSKAQDNQPKKRKGEAEMPLFFINVLFKNYTYLHYPIQQVATFLNTRATLN
ncbi:MAG: hypothetical protein IGS48_13430 [Oscillatoriales cyanobacterium C42_A2020_001]|nr:hypothetical protein [Leptolyngbyaceae cyanobacterium C42_A2020_001]